MASERKQDHALLGLIRRAFRGEAPPTEPPPEASEDPELSVTPAPPLEPEAPFTAEIIRFPLPYVDPTFFEPYPGYPIGALKGNEILFVQPQTIGRTNAQLFQTTTLDIANLASATAEGITGVVYTSNNSTLTIPAVANLVTIVRQDTPAPLTVQLPAGPGVNLYVGVKDGGNSFSVNNAQVVTTDGLEIDGVAGVTGYTMGVDREAVFFLFDGTMWNIL